MRTSNWAQVQAILELSKAKTKANTSPEILADPIPAPYTTNSDLVMMMLQIYNCLNMMQYPVKKSNAAILQQFQEGPCVTKSCKEPQNFY